MEQQSATTIRVLWVGGRSGGVGSVGRDLSRESDRLRVDIATNASSCFEQLVEENQIECIVSGYDLPGTSGLEFLDTVREEYPDLPFIMYTDRGSEAVASEAISRGVTDYIEKTEETSQYTELTTRIETAVEEYRIQQLQIDKKECQSLFEQAPVMYAVTRNSGGKPIIEECNQKFLDKLGYARDEVLGEPLDEFYTRESTQALYEDGYSRALAGEFGTEERVFVTASGNEIETLLRAVPRWDENGETVGTLTLYVDITERKRREQRIKRERDRLGAVFDAAPYPLVHVTFEDDQPFVNRINEAFEDVFGFEEREIQDESLIETIVPDDEKPVAKGANVQAGETEAVMQEVVRETADGEQREFLFAAATFAGGEGTVEGIGTYVDITERNRRIETLNQIKQNISDVVWITSPGQDQMEFVSDSYEDVWGRPPESLVEDPMSFFDAIHPDDRDRVQTALTVQQEHPDDYEETYRVVKPDGEVRWVHDSSTGIYDDGELTGIMGVAHDITERKRREQELERERAFIEQAVDALDDIFYVVGTDGTLRRWNDSFAEVTGYSHEELATMNATDFFRDDDREEVGKAIQRTLDTGQIVIEAAFVTADGEQIPYEFTGARLTDPDGDLIGVVGIGRDISERKARERELRTFQEAVENAGHAIYWTDTDATIQYANPAFEEQTGYSVSEAIGQSPSILNSGVQSDDFYKNMWETIQAGQTWEDEIINRRKNGERFMISQSISPVYEDGEISRYVAVDTEITQRYQREQQLSVLQRVLRHDLRNNLNEILLATQLLEQELDEPDVMDPLDAIRQTVEETLSLACKVQELRKIFQRDENDIQELNLAERARTQVSSVQAERQHVEFTLDLPSEAYVATTELIDQAIRNIIQNAIEHNDAERTEIEVTLEHQRNAEEVALCIADNGPGIPQHEIDVLESDHEEELHHLSGFGLWLVNWVVSLSGGDVEFADNDPRGTVVKLILPTVD
jgi:PAS domain S-box-containing protein